MPSRRRIDRKLFRDKTAVVALRRANSLHNYLSVTISSVGSGVTSSVRHADWRTLAARDVLALPASIRRRRSVNIDSAGAIESQRTALPVVRDSPQTTYNARQDPLQTGSRSSMLGCDGAYSKTLHQLRRLQQETKMKLRTTQHDKTTTISASITSN